VVFGAARGGLIVLALVALGVCYRWRGSGGAKYFSAPLETAVLACKPSCRRKWLNGFGSGRKISMCGILSHGEHAGQSDPLMV
jgi:hypothetical protein